MKKLGVTIFVIYSALVIFVLPLIYATKQEHGVWLSSQVPRKEIFFLIDRRHLLHNFTSIIDLMYAGSNLVLPPELFRLEDIMQAGVTVSAKPRSVDTFCSDQELDRYRSLAKSSLFYSPTVFRTGDYTGTDWPYDIPPIIDEHKYPAVMLFIPANSPTTVTVLECDPYLIFFPEAFSVIR